LKQGEIAPQSFLEHNAATTRDLTRPE